MNVCHLSDVQTVVTNAEADPACLKRLNESGITVVQAEKYDKGDEV